MATIDPGAAPTGPSRTPAGGALSGRDREKLKEACAEFEAYFWRVLLEESGLSGTGDSSGSLLGSDHSGMVSESVSKSLSRSGSLGIADVIYRSLLRSYGGSEDAS